MCILCEQLHKVNASNTDLMKELLNDSRIINVKRGTLIDFMADYTLMIDATGAPKEMIPGLLRESFIGILFADNPERGRYIFGDIAPLIVRRVAERMEGARAAKEALEKYVKVKDN